MFPVDEETRGGAFRFRKTGWRLLVKQKYVHVETRVLG